MIVMWEKVITVIRESEGSDVGESENSDVRESDDSNV